MKMAQEIAVSFAEPSGCDSYSSVPHDAIPRQLQAVIGPVFFVCGRSRIFVSRTEVDQYRSLE
jgi:hypothetical protein